MAWEQKRWMFNHGRKRQLFGCLATKDDLELFNQHSQGKYALRSYNEMVVSQMKQMSEDNQQLTWCKQKIAKEKRNSKALKESLNFTSEKPRKTAGESRIVKQMSKVHHQQNQEESLAPINKKDSWLFWLTLYLTAAAWIILAIFSLIRFQADYLLVVAVCLSLSTAYIAGSTKCRKGKQRFKQLSWFKQKVAKEKRHSKAMEESLNFMSEKLRKAADEIRIVKQMSKTHRQQNYEKGSTSLVMFALVLLSLIPMGACATTHVVGGTSGWDISVNMTECRKVQPLSRIQLGDVVSLSEPGDRYFISSRLCSSGLKVHIHVNAVIVTSPAVHLTRPSDDHREDGVLPGSKGDHPHPTDGVKLESGTYFDVSVGLIPVVISGVVLIVIAIALLVCFPSAVLWLLTRVTRGGRRVSY